MAEEHALSLSKLCRFCGFLLTSYTRTVAEHNEKILKCFYIDVNKDNEHIHPKLFCHKCYSHLENISKRDTTAARTFITWTKHDNINCFSCQAPSRLKKGGRPRKRKHIGTPSIKSTWTREDSSQLSKQITFNPSELPPISLLDPEINPCLDLCICKICNELLRKPVLNVNCQHVSCLRCLLARVEGQELNRIKCPLCILDIVETLKPTSFVAATTIEQILKKLRISCRKGCGKFFAIIDYPKVNEHENSCFPPKEQNHPIEKVFSLEPTQKIPKLYEEAAVHILKNKMAQSTLPNKSVEFKTGGSKV